MYAPYFFLPYQIKNPTNTCLLGPAYIKCQHHSKRWLINSLEIRFQMNDNVHENVCVPSSFCHSIFFDLPVFFRHPLLSLSCLASFISKLYCIGTPRLDFCVQIDDAQHHLTNDLVIQIMRACIYIVYCCCVCNRLYAYGWWYRMWCIVYTWYVYRAHHELSLSTAQKLHPFVQNRFASD